MVESKIKGYQFENNRLYDEFEGDNPLLRKVELAYLTTEYPNGGLSDYSTWDSYFHHDAGTSIEIRKREVNSDLLIVGLEEYIKKTKESLEKIFGKLIEVKLSKI